MKSPYELVILKIRGEMITQLNNTTSVGKESVDSNSYQLLAHLSCDQLLCYSNTLTGRRDIDYELLGLSSLHQFLVFIVGFRLQSILPRTLP